MEPGTSVCSEMKETMKMLHRIYNKLGLKKKQTIESYKKHYGDGFSNSVLYASILTGLHPCVLLKIKDGSVNPSKTEYSPSLCIDRADILGELKIFYFVKQIMPTTRQLYDALQEKLPPYMDIASFRKQLAFMDFMWRHISQRFYVIERPEVVYERYKYLKCIIEYHDQNKPIYFIDEMAFKKVIVNNKCTSYHVSNDVNYPGTEVKIVYAASKHGIMFNCVENFNGKELGYFLCDTIMPNLAENSLIVMKNTKHHCDQLIKSKPSLDSLICDLKEWLDLREIPYDENMCKAELYALVEKCTDKDNNFYVADNIFTARGHTVIRIPDHIENLTPTNLIFNVVQTSHVPKPFEGAQLRNIAIQFFESFDENHLESYFDIVMKENIKLFNDDVKIDDMLDSLVTKMAGVTFDGEEDSDIPSDSESDVES
ncbi:unnamed protein product [Diatraea saccharalis]|uniref:Uncharacterized protein n=1 Tax=Diatraea saccharalis TaxID=40085 RepID=A0A9N9RG78_9NEOP|nr:unnamed protein product [Diatraea saccharalis]